MKKLTRRLLSWVPDRAYLTMRYVYRFRQLPDLSRPRRFNENIVALMLSDQDYELRRIFADKIEANRYIERVVGKDYITPVIDVITPENLDSFNLDRLPDRFVAKTAHASGFVRVVRDKTECDEAALIHTFRDWMKIDFHSYCRERVYKNLPKRIVIEEFLCDRITGDVPLDYKVFVFRGRAKMLQIDLSRFEGHRRVLMDRNWSPYPCRLKQLYPDEIPPRPERLEEMLSLAEKLASEVNFARVDFYDTSDRLIVGEITNFPGSGNEPFYPSSWDMEFGKWFSDADYEPT